MRSNVIKLIYVVFVMFLSLIVYLSYLYLIKSEFLTTHPKNPRLGILEKEVDRGSILDRRGLVLAQSEIIKGSYKREYPFGEAFAHVVGYTTERGIKTGLEAKYNAYLLGLEKEQRAKNFIRELQGKTRQGLDITTTLDADLQLLGQQLLKGKKGSIVVLNPKTGEVLALVSSPTFNPNHVNEGWAELNANETDQPLLNRATKGMYPPGSILKVMTGAGILEKDPLFEETFQCPGYFQIGNYRLQDLTAHGKVDFDEAMALSCNTTFAQLGLMIGREGFYDLALKFNFNTNIEFDLGVKKSFIPEAATISEEELAQSVIGQGRILVTPLHMALLTGVIANKGEMMQPYVVSEVKSQEGTIIRHLKSRQSKRTISEAAANRLKKAMEKVVSEGTGQRAAIRGIEVAGKTGSAENPHGQAHSWFIGFAPSNEPQIAVAVIVENGGFGGQEAATIAKSILEKALKD